MGKIMNAFAVKAATIPLVSYKPYGYQRQTKLQAKRATEPRDRGHANLDMEAHSCPVCLLVRVCVCPECYQQ